MARTRSTPAWRARTLNGMGDRNPEDAPDLGVRRGELLTLRWAHVHLDDKQVIEIPDTKNGDPLILPLSPPAVAILAKLAAARHSEWVAR